MHQQGDDQRRQRAVVQRPGHGSGSSLPYAKPDGGADESAGAERNTRANSAIYAGAERSHADPQARRQSAPNRNACVPAKADRSANTAPRIHPNAERCSGDSDAPTGDAHAECNAAGRYIDRDAGECRAANYNTTCDHPNPRANRRPTNGRTLARAN